MSQLESIKKQIETVDKVLADTRKQAEEIRQETMNKVSEQLEANGIHHKQIDYSIDSIQLGATKDRNDISIYTKSNWQDETKVKIELNWYASSATVGVEGDQRHLDYLVMAGEIAKAVQNSDFVKMLIDTRAEYIQRIKETGVHDMYSLKDKLEREYNETERALKKATLKVGATYVVKKRVDFGRRNAYWSWDNAHPVKLVISKMKNKTADITEQQWNNWDSNKASYRDYGTRQHKISEIIYWIQNGYIELAS